MQSRIANTVLPPGVDMDEEAQELIELLTQAFLDRASTTKEEDFKSTFEALIGNKVPGFTLSLPEQYAHTLPPAHAHVDRVATVAAELASLNPKRKKRKIETNV